jgi:transcriptional regulator with XRE-family HTH domain
MNSCENTNKKGGNTMTLGTRIKAILKFKGIPQRELAKAIGVNECMITRWTKNLNKPSIDNIEKIANFLGCTIFELLGYSKLFNEFIDSCAEGIIEKVKLL